VLAFHYKIKFIVTFELIQLDTSVGIIEKKEAIQLLKTNIQSELGKTITTRRHCEELEFEVLRKTGIKLSYNTIRRFFNLAGERSISQPTVATLDVLSNYSGFRDFHSLKIGMTKSESLESVTPGQINILSGIFHLTGKQKVTFLENHISDNSWPLMVSMVSERAAAIGDRDFFFFFFDSAIIFQNSNYLNQRLYFGMQYLGVIIRGLTFRKELQCHLASHEFGRKFYYELFVDMDTLVRAHYVGIKNYFSASVSDQDKIFAAALLHFRSFIAGNKSSQDKWLAHLKEIPLNVSNIHPIPLARLLNAFMFEDLSNEGCVSKETNKFIQLQLKQILKRILINGQADMFFFWLLEGAVICSNWKIAMQCIAQLDKFRPKKLAYYDVGSYEFYKALKGIVLYRLGNVKKAKQYLSDVDASKFYSFSFQYDSIFFKALNCLVVQSVELEKEGKGYSKSLGYGKLWGYLTIENSNK
jgi:hypothetical protein